MTLSLNKPTIGSTDWGNDVNDNWTDIENAVFSKDYIAGLVTSNNGTDSDHDIDIATGVCRDTGNTAIMELSSTLTKQIDAAWAVGTNQGGLDTGSVAADTLYAIWLIKRSDTGVVDALFSTSFSSPTMPTNYDKKQLIAAIYTDASSNIRAYKQTNNYFLYQDPVVEISDNTITDAAFETGTLTGIPPNCLGDIYAIHDETSNTSQIVIVLRGNGQTTSFGSTWSFVTLGSSSNFIFVAARKGWIQVDGNSQIQYAFRQLAGTTTASISSNGFLMLTRGKG